MPPSFLALGPNNPGASAMYIADIVFENCGVSNYSSSATLMSGFVIGNNTAGNVLANVMRDCFVAFCAYGVTAGGSGFVWDNGGMSNNTQVDFFITSGGGDPITIRGNHFENGNCFFYMGYVGPAPPILFDNCFAGNYTPTYSSVAHAIVDFRPAGTLTILGGAFSTIAGNTVISQNTLGGAKNTLVSIGTLLDNVAGWPAANTANCQRIIIGASYMLATVPTPNPNFVFVADGVLDSAAVGSGLAVKEGSNAKQGVATLSSGTVVVGNTSVTATSRIMLTVQSLGTITVPSALAVSARTAGTSFTILASALTDTSVIAYEIFEPG